jgi:predicted nucleotide-binding protein
MTAPAASARSNRIAIVCRDDNLGETVTSFVAQLGLEPVISQQPRADASSLESLEALRQTDFALVVQADRQLEIGFLLATLGRQRIFVLHDGEQTGLPGLPRQPLDDDGLWRLLLAREMKKSGLDVDLNKAI